MQVLHHAVSRSDGAVTLYGRGPDGGAVTCVIPRFRTIWVRDAARPRPPNPSSTEYRQGRGLLATDACVNFAEYGFTGRLPRKDDGETGWYNRRLGKVEAWYVRENITPCTWFTGTQYTTDAELAAAADRDNGTWAPFRLLVFDMECLPKADGGFPTPGQDPIIQISAVVDMDMLGEDPQAESHLFTWRDTTAPLPQIDEYDPAGCTVHVCCSEESMLTDFVQLVALADPDVLSGWNIVGFDLPYLMARCAALGVVCGLGRGGLEARSFKPAEGAATRITVAGRIVADMLPMWRAQHTERSYKLGDVATRHLQASKAPVGYSDMRPLWDSDADGRARMATYCLKDSWLVWRLGVTRSIWMNAVQMSKVTYVPLDRIINGGQQIRVFTLLTHYAHRSRIYIPDNVPLCDAGYEGAVVLPPLPGFYRDCVVTLDFASLYPSIMMAFNMCYTTQRTEVAPWELGRSLGVPAHVAERIMDYATVPVQAVPADARVYHRCGSVDFRREPQGILPTILSTLLKRRKAAKREMAGASGLARAIANGRQLALKLVANSIYGFTGAAELGMLPQPQIAAAVTYMGRKLTLGTKALCEKQKGVTCVYGDTDSVFLRLDGVTDIAEASRRAEKLAAMVDALIPAPNRLEFEKVYRPLLLRGKKRYCGRKYEEGQGDGELDVKGLEMVRRDNFPLLPNTQRAAMNQLVMHNDPVGADDIVRRVLQRIQCETPEDLTEFTIAKELTKPPEQYAVAPPHVRVALGMHPLPSVRDRVPYVVLRGHGSIGDRALHPDSFKPGVHELDTAWYAEQVTKAMRRVLELSSSDVDAVFAAPDGKIMGSGSSGILRMLGAPPDLTWRRRTSAAAPTRPAKRAKQLDITRFF